MAKLRDPSKDKLKPGHIIQEQFIRGTQCKHAECNEPVSIFEGPGGDIFCREHQIELAEYGGMGRADRLHTFFRDWVCSKCGYDAREDPEIKSIEDPEHRLTVMRGVMHGDHKIRKSDGGSDTKDNIDSLCCRCHMIKTFKEKDYLKGNPQ